MTKRRTTIAALMLAIAIIAINVALVRFLASLHPRLAFGLAPGALCLQFMSWVFIRHRSRLRAFSAGFLTFGGFFACCFFHMFLPALALPNYVNARSSLVQESPGAWTLFWYLCDERFMLLFVYLAERLPWIFELAETDGAVGMSVGAIVVFSIQFIFALVGGLLALFVFCAVRRLVRATISKPPTVTPQK